MVHKQESSETPDSEEGEFCEVYDEDAALERMYEVFKKRKQLGWDASDQLAKKGKIAKRYKDVKADKKYL